MSGTGPERPTAGRDRALATTRKLQIIVGSLTGGAFTFMVIAAVKSFFVDQGVDRAETGLMVYMAFGWVAVSLIARAVVPPIITLAGRRHLARREAASGYVDISTDEQSRKVPVADALLNLYFTRTLLGAAIVEGAAFFALAVSIIEEEPICLMLGGLMIVGIALHFPTRTRVTQWLETQQLLLQEERQLQTQRGL